MAMSRKLAAAVCLVKLGLQDDNDDDIDNNVCMMMYNEIEADEEILLAAASAAVVMQSSNDRPEGCVPNFFEAVIPKYSISTFRSHFRMNPSTLEVLCRELAPHLAPKAAHYSQQVCPAKKISMAVWFLSNMEVFRSIANLYGFENKGSAHLSIMEVIHALANKLFDVYIKWPTVDECQRIASAFEDKFGFPNVIGCIDGTHVPIKAPAKERDGFINRKGFPSVNVLAVCNDKMKYTHVFVDRAGSVHDARVLRVSPLGPLLQANTLTSGEYHLLGDSGYPLLPQLLVPYRDNGHLNATQKKFNTIHSCTRSVVEQSFARLKGKMRRLRGIEATLVTNSLSIIKAAFVMHNFILEHDDDTMDDDFDDDICGEEDGSRNSHDHDRPESERNLRLQAQNKRDSIASLF